MKNFCTRKVTRPLPVAVPFRVINVPALELEDCLIALMTFRALRRETRPVLFRLLIVRVAIWPEIYSGAWRRSTSWLTHRAVAAVNNVIIGPPASLLVATGLSRTEFLSKWGGGASPSSTWMRENRGGSPRMRDAGAGPAAATREDDTGGAVPHALKVAMP